MSFKLRKQILQTSLRYNCGNTNANIKLSDIIKMQDNKNGNY